MKKLVVLLACAAPLAISPARAADPGAYLVAEFAAHQGNFPLAADSMQTALSADPSSAVLREDDFILALLAGSPRAEALARDLPDNPLGQLLLGAMAARDGDWKGAELGFAELPHQKLADMLRPLLVAWAQEAQGEFDRAFDTMQPALASNAVGAVGELNAALLADASHRDGLAQRLYGDLAASQRKPSLQFALLYASWQARAGHLAAARATIDAAVKAAPELAIAEPGLVAALAHAQAPTAVQGMAMALIDVAAAAKAANTDLDALLVRIALVMDPRSANGWLFASEIAAGHGHWHLAAADLTHIPASDPMTPVIQLRLAGLLARDNDTEQAVDLLHQLAHAYPEQPAPLVALGDTLVADKKLPAAIDAYDHAIAMLAHPTSDDWAIFYARGSALEQMHEWPRAEADMNRALELSPGQPYVLNFLGYSMAERDEDLPRARAMIEQALKQMPNDGAVVDSLGWVLLRQGKTAEAVDVLQKAAELLPEDPSVNGHLGDAYWQAGRKIEAEDQWRRALVLKPDPDDQARIAARLKAATGE